MGPGDWAGDLQSLRGHPGLGGVPSSHRPSLRQPGQTQLPAAWESRGGGGRGREGWVAQPAHLPTCPQHPLSAGHCQVPLPSLWGGVRPLLEQDEA